MITSSREPKSTDGRTVMVLKRSCPFSAFVTPDDLHMNDWGYGCLAKLLGTAIAEAATRGVASAQAHAVQRTVP